MSTLTDGLATYEQTFKTIVLHHLATVLSKAEWHALRATSGSAKPWTGTSDVPQQACPMKGLVESYTSEDLLAVNEVLTPVFKPQATVIAEIEGQPVHYIGGAGIYVWGRDPTERRTLMLWVSSPAYPPGW